MSVKIFLKCSFFHSFKTKSSVDMFNLIKIKVFLLFIIYPVFAVSTANEGLNIITFEFNTFDNSTIEYQCIQLPSDDNKEQWCNDFSHLAYVEAIRKELGCAWSDLGSKHGVCKPRVT